MSSTITSTRSILRAAERSVRSRSPKYEKPSRRKEGRSISFDIEEDAITTEKTVRVKEQPKRVSTAPTPQGRSSTLPRIEVGEEGEKEAGRHSHTAESYLDAKDNDLFMELERERTEFRLVQQR